MKLTKTTLFLVSTVAFALGSSQSAVAQTQTSSPANLTVSANVVNQCVIQAATLSFGDYVFTAASESDTSMSLNCSPGTSPVVRLSTGANAGGGGQRNMSNGTDSLRYDLFTDSTRLNAWPAAGFGISASATSVQIYGRIPANQNLTTGSYSDTVVATIDF